MMSEIVDGGEFHEIHAETGNEERPRGHLRYRYIGRYCDKEFMNSDALDPDVDVSTLNPETLVIYSPNYDKPKDEYSDDDADYDPNPAQAFVNKCRRQWREVQRELEERGLVAHEPPYVMDYDKEVDDEDLDVLIEYLKRTSPSNERRSASSLHDNSSKEKKKTSSGCFDKLRSKLACFSSKKVVDERNEALERGESPEKTSWCMELFRAKKT